MLDANLALLLVFAVLLVLGTPIAVALGIGGVVGILIGLTSQPWAPSAPTPGTRSPSTR